MTEKKRERYREILRTLAARVLGDAAALEAEVRTATGGDAQGNLSGAPLHLADLGTEVFMQELSSTLLENETAIRDEILAAMRRLDDGTYGRCESCGEKIIAARLAVIPYSRYCTLCAEQMESRAVNFNSGRSADCEPMARQATKRDAGFGPRQERVPVADTVDEGEDESREPADIHAAGTPGGGAAVGGLAGTNAGDGDPDDTALEEALGSGNFDPTWESDEEETPAYAGPTGGAVGGTPAGKRAVGGKWRKASGE